MRNNIISANFTIGTDETHWSRTFIKDQLFVSAEIAGEKAQELGKQFLSNLEKNFVLHPPKTLEEFKKFLVDCTRESSSIKFVAGLLLDLSLYTVISKEGSVYIEREEKFGSILTDAGSVSGTLKIGDLVILVSKDLTKYIKPETIKETLKLKNPVEISDGIIAQLYKQETIPLISGIIISVVDEKQLKNEIKFKTINIAGRLKSAFHLPRYTVVELLRLIKPYVTVTLILVVLLAVSIIFGIQKRQNDIRETQLADVLGTVSHKFEEGMALIDLNPIRARQLLAEAKELLESKQQNKNEKTEKEIAEYVKKIDSGLEIASRSYEITPVSFFELDLIKTNAKGNKMSLYQDSLAILDSNNKSIYRLSIVSKSSRIIASGDDLTSAAALGIHGEDIYVLTDSIRKVILGDTSLSTVIEKDDEWGKIKDIKVYGGNLYLLDGGKNWIWKYIREENGFSSRQDYFVFDTLVDLQNADNLVIDGSVWLTKNDGILRFTQGKENVWQVKGIDSALGNNLDFYLDDTTKNAYILDSNNKRVVVADKEGMYLSQYKWKEDLKFDDFVVSEVVKKILLLSAGTIYGIDLK